jgi:hypothetical protein
MNEFERELVEFVLAWNPYHGPSEEDAFVRFGMSRERLWEQFCRIVALYRARSRLLPADSVALIRRAETLISSSDDDRNSSDDGTAAVAAECCGYPPPSGQTLSLRDGRWILQRGVAMAEEEFRPLEPLR